MVLWVTGCAAGDSAPAWMLDQSLADAHAWQPVAPEQDPVPHHRPADVRCPEGAWYVEAGSLEVETGNCNYAALSQPIPQPVAAGEPIRAVLWHDRLVFEQPAEAHVGLWLDRVLLWETTVPIPAEAHLYEVQVDAPADAEQGAALVFHLHNHGFNSWSLLEVERQQ